MEFIIGAIISGIIGVLIAYLVKIIIDIYRNRKRNKFVVEFFGIKKGIRTRIVHSSIFDTARNAYSLPACDMRVTSSVVSLLESMDLKEGIDFVINADTELMDANNDFIPEVMQENLILICGPKRNKLTAKMLDRLPSLHYQLSKDQNDNNVIYDSIRGTYLISSQDMNINSNQAILAGHDFGIIISTPDPANNNRNIVVLAGIHGSGTLGAGMFISNTDNLRELCRRRQNGLIQEVVAANYKGHLDNVVNVKLA